MLVQTNYSYPLSFNKQSILKTHEKVYVLKLRNGKIMYFDINMESIRKNNCLAYFNSSNYLSFSHYDDNFFHTDHLFDVVEIRDIDLHRLLHYAYLEEDESKKMFEEAKEVALRQDKLVVSKEEALKIVKNHYKGKYREIEVEI